MPLEGLWTRSEACKGSFFAEGLWTRGEACKGSFFEILCPRRGFGRGVRLVKGCFLRFFAPGGALDGERGSLKVDVAGSRSR